MITLQVTQHLLQVSNLCLQGLNHFLLLQEQIWIWWRLLSLGMRILLGNHRWRLLMNTWICNDSLYWRSLIQIWSNCISFRLLVNLKIYYLSSRGHLLIRTKLSRIFGTVSSRIRFLNIDLYLKISLDPSTPILNPHCELHLILLLVA